MFIKMTCAHGSSRMWCQASINTHSFCLMKSSQVNHCLRLTKNRETYNLVGVNSSNNNIYQGE